MKIVSVEISVEHIPDIEGESEEFSEDASKMICTRRNESFSLSVNQEMEDSQSVRDVVRQVADEVVRRYMNLNARKTN